MAEIRETYRIVGENATSAAFNQILRQSKTTADRMSSFFKTAFAGISILSVGRFLGQQIELNEQLAHGAIKAGIKAKAYTELAYAGRQLEIGHDALSTSLKKMQVSLSEAASGGKEQLETLDALGLQIEELKRLEPDKQFEAIAEQISRIKDPADKTRAAVELFGRAGADLLPLFEQGAAGIRKAREEAQAFGKSMTEEDLAVYRKADDALDQIKESATGAGNAFLIILAPAISQVSDEFALLTGYAPKILKLRTELEQLENAAISPKLASMGIEAIETRIRAIRLELVELQAAGLGKGAPSRASLMASAPPGFGGSAGDEAAKARLELMALGDPIDKLTAQFETQKAKIDELVKKYPQLAGVAGQAIEQITKDYKASVDVATEELRRLDRQAALSRRTQEEILAPLEVIGDEGAEAEMARRMEAIRRDNMPLTDRTIQFGEALDVAEDSASKLMATLKDEAARRGLDALSDVILNMGDGMDDFAKSAIDAFRRILADAAARQLFSLFSNMGKGGGSGGGFWGAIASGLGALFGSIGGGSSGGGSFRGFAAHGKTLNPGEWAIAGEDGAEPVFGGKHGATIIPFPKGGRAGGGQSVSVTVAPQYSIVLHGSDRQQEARMQDLVIAANRAAVDEAEVRIVTRLQRGIYDLRQA